MRLQARVSSQAKIELALKRFSFFAAALSLAIALLVLLAWKFGIVAVITAGSDHTGMARSTAVALALLGVCLLCLSREPYTPKLRRVVIVCSLITMTLGLSTLLRVAGLLPARFEENVLFGPLWTGLASMPVRMAPNTALSLILLGFSCLLIDFHIGGWRPAQWAAILAAMIVLAACIGYGYDVRSLYGFAGYTNMAFHSAATLLIIALGILCARPRTGMMSLLTREGPVGIMVRRLLPSAVLLPILAGWLCLKGEHAGWYRSETTLVLFATFSVVLLLLFLYLAIASRSAAEETFRALLEGAPDPMVIVDERGYIVFINTQAEKLFGYLREELIGVPVEILLPETLREEHVLDRVRYVLSPQTRPMGERLGLHARRRDGTELPVEVCLAPIRRDGTTLISSTIRDISLRKRIEQALRDSEERFRVALKDAPVVVFNQDRELRYTWINSTLAWAQQNPLGYTDEEMVGGEEGARLTSIKRHALESGIGCRSEVSVTFQGELHYFDLKVEPLRDAQNQIIGITCSCSDITVIKQGAAERERLIRELQDALAQVKVLTGLLPICASCKKIRDEQGRWNSVEKYIRERSTAEFTHGICPDCARRLYPELYKS